jgi:acyl carrier protein
MPTVTAQMQERVLGLVQTILARNGKTAVAASDARLVEIGLTSMDMVDLMLEVEAAFDVTITPSDLNAENFQSIATIGQMITRLTGQVSNAQAA